MTTDLIKKLESSEKLWPSLLAAKQKIRDCFKNREPVVAMLNASPLAGEKLTPEYIEQLINQTGREIVFERAKQLGWPNGGAPLFVWNVICQDIQRSRTALQEKGERG